MNRMRDQSEQCLRGHSFERQSDGVYHCKRCGVCSAGPSHRETPHELRHGSHPQIGPDHAAYLKGLTQYLLAEEVARAYHGSTNVAAVGRINDMLILAGCRESIESDAELLWLVDWFGIGHKLYPIRGHVHHRVERNPLERKRKNWKRMRDTTTPSKGGGR